MEIFFVYLEQLNQSLDYDLQLLWEELKDLAEEHTEVIEGCAFYSRIGFDLLEMFSKLLHFLSNFVSEIGWILPDSAQQ